MTHMSDYETKDRKMSQSQLIERIRVLVEQRITAADKIEDQERQVLATQANSDYFSKQNRADKIYDDTKNKVIEANQLITGQVATLTKFCDEKIEGVDQKIRALRTRSPVIGTYNAASWRFEFSKAILVFALSFAIEISNTGQIRDAILVASPVTAPVFALLISLAPFLGPYFVWGHYKDIKRENGRKLFRQMMGLVGLVCLISWLVIMNANNQDIMFQLGETTEINSDQSYTFNVEAGAQAINSAIEGSSRSSAIADYGFVLQILMSLSGMVIGLIWLGDLFKQRGSQYRQEWREELARSRIALNEERGSWLAYKNQLNNKASSVSQNAHEYATKCKQYYLNLYRNY